MRRFLIGVLLLTAAGCSEPPQKELDQAQSAIDAARAAGAETYAAPEYADATATLAKARASIDERDYRQALSFALAARQRADEASRLVPEARTHAKATADAAFAAASSSAVRLESSLRAAEAAKVPARELHAPRATLATARTSLQEARILLDHGNFTEATPALLAVRKKLDLAAAEVTSIPPRAKAGKGSRR